MQNVILFCLRKPESGNCAPITTPCLVSFSNGQRRVYVEGQSNCKRSAAWTVARSDIMRHARIPIIVMIIHSSTTVIVAVIVVMVISVVGAISGSITIAIVTAFIIYIIIDTDSIASTTVAYLLRVAYVSVAPASGVNYRCCCRPHVQRYRW